MIDVIHKSSKGKTITFTTQPVVGVIGLLTYSQTLLGVNSTDFFLTTVFRYSSNGGIDWSDWAELNNTNISAISFDPKDIITFEVVFTKSTPSPDLDVSVFEFATNDSSPNYTDAYFSKHLISKFIDSDDNAVVGWYMNVTKKLYEKGLLPDYIERKYEESNEDFLDFWNTITRFFAYYVVLGRKYGGFYDIDFLLDEYINQRGLVTSKNNTLQELQFLMASYYKQMGERGTHLIHKFSDKYHITDGELLRLINYQIPDKFTFLLFKKEDFGWNLGNSSPLYRGIKPFTITNDNHAFVVNSGITYTLWSEINVANATDIIKVELLEYSSLDTGNPPISTTVILNNIKLQRTNKNLPLKVNLYKFGTVLTTQVSSVSNFGVDVILQEQTRYVEVITTLNGSVVGGPTITNMTLQPSYTDYSRGFLQTVNWIHIWLVNRNREYSKHQLKKFISYYLLPYNTHLELTELPIINMIIEENLLLLQTGDKVLMENQDFVNLIN